MFHSVLRHVRRVLQAESISLGEIEIDPITGQPKGVIGKIILREPTVNSRKLGMVTPDDLFEKVDTALRMNGRKIWILLDRLDVVFARIFPSMGMDGSMIHPLDWMMSRLHDGSGQVTPRELIHFLAQAREIQLVRLEVGVKEPADEALFYKLAFTIALREVSRFGSIKPFARSIRSGSSVSAT